MLRPGIVGKGPDDEFSWEWVLAQLNPDLPVEAFLTEGIVFAGNALHCARTNINGGGDLFDGGIVGSPLEEIDQGNLDAVIVIDLIDQLRGRGRGWDGRVVILELSVDGKVFSIVEEEYVFIVTFQLRAKEIGAHRDESICSSVGKNLPVIENVVVRNFGVDLKRLETSQVGTHFVECF